MGRQSKGPKQENFGKGKVTPLQVAFMVDRYLSENNYTKTLSVFRSEASGFFSKTKGGQAPKTLLSLGVILDEYICLKEQKLMVEHEKSRVDKLLQGMQDVMNAYNSDGTIATIPMRTTTPILQPVPGNGSNAAQSPIYNCAATNTICMPPGYPSNYTHPSAPTAVLPPTKRKGPRPVSEIPHPSKKPCAVFPSTPSGDSAPKVCLQEASIHEANLESSHIQSSGNDPQNGSSVQGPRVVSDGPNTPPQPSSSHVDKSTSPSESSSACDSHARRTPPEIIPNNCHVISSKTVIVSPCKHIRISSSPMKLTPGRSNKREHIKARLDFNECDVSICSERPVAEQNSCPATNNGILDILTDDNNLDIFCPDFSLSEFLVDFDFDSEGMDFASMMPFDYNNGPENMLTNEVIGANGGSSDPLSSVTFLSQNEVGTQGPESILQMKSVTKCIQIVSPAKNRRLSLEQLN